MSTSFLFVSCFHVREMHVARDNDRCLAARMRCNAACNHCIHWLQSDWTGSTSAHDGFVPVHQSCVHVVPRPGFEPGASCSVDKRAIQLRYRGNVHMMAPMRLAFRRPSRIQPASGGFRILPGESE